MLNEISSCEVCGKKELQTALHLGLHPLCDDLIPLGEARVCKEYPIEILFCDHCITAHQRFQVSKHELFPMTYHYRARHTADVIDGMRSLVAACEKYGLRDKKVLDIGCNDGSLLNFFAEKKAKTFGVEPTGAFTEAIQMGHVVSHHFFCVEVAEDLVKQHGPFDIIVFTNVFAHIEHLAEVIAALKIVMQPQTIIIIENHYLGAIVNQFQFDTFYHEHPRTYSFTSFIHIAGRLGLQIEDVLFPSRYSGNIRVILTSNKKDQQTERFKAIQEKELCFGMKLMEIQKQLPIWREKTLDYIRSQVKNYGKLSAKAFPGRAAIPIKLLGLNEEWISAVYEKPTSAKINHYVPGTRIPILSDTALHLSTHAPLINFAWHIHEEIEFYLKGLGFTGMLFDILPQIRHQEIDETQ